MREGKSPWGEALSQWDIGFAADGCAVAFHRSDFSRTPGRRRPTEVGPTRI